MACVSTVVITVPIAKLKLQSLTRTASRRLDFLSTVHVQYCRVVIPR